jgi:hypothetical protein
MNRKVTPASVGRTGAPAGVPTDGKSAIELEQPPSASANSSPAANVSAFIFRSADIIRPEVLTSPS